MSSADGEDTMATVVKVINSLVASIDVADKTLSVVIANSYLTELFNLVFPDLGLKAPDFDLGRNAISINLNRGFYTLFDGATAQQLFYAKDDKNGTQVAVYDENGGYVIENYDKTNPAHFGLHRYDFYVYLEGAYVKYDPTNPTHAKLDKYVLWDATASSKWTSASSPANSEFIFLLRPWALRNTTSTFLKKTGRA